MFQRRRAGIAVVAAMVSVAMTLIFTGAAQAAILTTWFNGDLVAVHETSTLGNGNSQNGMSIQWFNRGVTLSGLSGWYTTYEENAVDPSDAATSDVASSYTTYTVNGSAPATFTGPITFSAEGTYSVVAGSTDGSGTPFSGSIWSQFLGADLLGIDMTPPTVSSNALPVYDQSATVTVSVQDTLSGPQTLLVSLDGEPVWGTAHMGPWTSTWSTDVGAGVGAHVLKFFAFDTAGNFSGVQQVAFAVNPLGYTPKLSNVSVKVAKKRKVTFTGSVTAATSAATVKLTVDTRVGRKWKNGTAIYFVTVPRYVGSYSLAKTFKKAGTYRVTAYEGSGHSAKAVTFSVK